MEKRLIAVITFGVLALSISNLLLSVGVVSFLLVNSQDTGNQGQDAIDFSAGFPMANSSASVTDIDDTIKGMAYKDHTVGEEITAAIAKIGENIQLGGVVLERSDDAGDYLQD